MLLTLGRVGDRVQVRVRDYSPDPPVLRSTEDDPSRGWGLRMIDKAASWGWVPHPDGKTVWASIELSPRIQHPFGRSCTRRGRKTLAEVLKAPVDALAGVSEGDAKLLKEAFNIKTVQDLCKNKFFRGALLLTQLAEAGAK
jgi:hypothetical protein